MRLRAGGKRGHALAVSSRYLTLFPNFVIGFYQPDQIGVHLNCPTGPSTTRQRRLIYSISDHDIGDPEAMALRDLWYQVHKEDHAMCERLQQGRLSEVAASGGLLSPHWEDSVRRFQEAGARCGHVKQPGNEGDWHLRPLRLSASAISVTQP